MALAADEVSCVQIWLACQVCQIRLITIQHEWSVLIADSSTSLYSFSLSKKQKHTKTKQKNVQEQIWRKYLEVQSTVVFLNRNFTYDFVCAKRKQMNWNWKANQPQTDESQITVLQHHSFHALGLFSISAAVIIHLPCLSSAKRVLYTQLLCFHKPSVSRGPREAGATPPRSWREAACLGFDAITSRRCMHLLIQSPLGRNPDHLPRLRFCKTALSVRGLRHRSGVSHVQRWTCRKRHYLSWRDNSQQVPAVFFCSVPSPGSRCTFASLLSSEWVLG